MLEARKYLGRQVGVHPESGKRIFVPFGHCDGEDFDLAIAHGIKDDQRVMLMMDNRADCEGALIVGDRYPGRLVGIHPESGKRIFAVGSINCGDVCGVCADCGYTHASVEWDVELDLSTDAAIITPQITLDDEDASVCGFPDQPSCAIVSTGPKTEDADIVCTQSLAVPCPAPLVEWKCVRFDRTAATSAYASTLTLAWGGFFWTGQFDMGIVVTETRYAYVYSPDPCDSVSDSVYSWSLTGTVLLWCERQTIPGGQDCAGEEYDLVLSVAAASVLTSGAGNLHICCWGTCDHQKSAYYRISNWECDGPLTAAKICEGYNADDVLTCEMDITFPATLTLTKGP